MTVISVQVSLCNYLLNWRSDSLVPVSAVPEKGGETQEFEVYDFKGAGGVGITMYNTDEVFI
jgi:hypothetical protein